MAQIDMVFSRFGDKWSIEELGDPPPPPPPTRMKYMNARKEQFILKTCGYETDFPAFNGIYRLFLTRNDPYFVSKKLVNYFSYTRKDLAGNR